MNAASLLTIDDDPSFVSITKTILEENGYDVRVAYDPDEGVARLEEEVPDVLILDIMMGRGAGGMVLARKIRKDSRFVKIPVLVLTSIREQTGFDFPGDPVHPKFFPIDEYVEKPVQPEVLLAKVKELVGSKTHG